MLPAQPPAPRPPARCAPPVVASASVTSLSGVGSLVAKLVGDNDGCTVMGVGPAVGADDSMISLLIVGIGVGTGEGAAVGDVVGDPVYSAGSSGCTSGASPPDVQNKSIEMAPRPSKW